MTILAATAQDAVKTWGSEIKVKTGSVSYINSDKTKATVEVFFIYEKNKVESFKSDEVNLIKTDKGWQIDAMEEAMKW